MIPAQPKAQPRAHPGDDPLWYKNAVIYELHVRAFYDSDGDGIGDFRGLTQKLDYLQDLGVTALWLLPFYPSPLRDDGYDISDYHAVHPSYGNMEDFRKLLREAHRRGLYVITELVINHTSEQHAWFQRARRAAPGSPERNFYVWNKTHDKYTGARIIFKDFETSNWAWDAVADAYYWHRFYSHQPDLNFEHPEVIRAIFQALDFWLKLGVDGLRLDAVPYLFEREGTNCENLPETHAFLRRLRAHLDRRYRNRMLLAEANQWPEDAVDYFGAGDESHMNFHFPLMPRLFMSIRMEDRFPIIDILDQTPAIPTNCQWALFLRNHDELTLEMVTEEERDYMYRVYAGDLQARINLGIRRRLAPLLGNNRRKIELMNGLLLSLPGSPVIYYGDEIGMGDNIYLGDRNAVRTPMQWTADRNAGFSRANPQRLYLPVIIDPEYHYESINVETQLNSPSSLLWWMRRLISLRGQFRAFGFGSLEFLQPENHKVLSFIRRFEEENILVVANLSRFSQCVELDLSGFDGYIPTELFGRTPFPAIGTLPYFITLGPHGFYWFALEPRFGRRETLGIISSAAERTPLKVTSEWTEVFEPQQRKNLERLLIEYLGSCRWFGGKARSIRRLEPTELFKLPFGKNEARLLFLRVEYTEGDPEQYFIPLAYTSGQRAEELLQGFPDRLITRLSVSARREEGFLYDPLIEIPFCEALLKLVFQRQQLPGLRGELAGSTARAMAPAVQTAPGSPGIHVLSAEQSNTSIVLEGRFILKLFRKLDSGRNPDLEIGEFLTQREFPGIPAVSGAAEYRSGRTPEVTVAILQAFVPNEGDAWKLTLDSLARYYERVASTRPELDRRLPVLDARLGQPAVEVPDLAAGLIGTYLEWARLLGKRTAELHLCLASSDHPNFAPEPFTALVQRSLYQSMRNLTGHVLRLLERSRSRLPAGLQADVQTILSAREDILGIFHRVMQQPLNSVRIRCHGDYHLGQVLFTGKDFVIIDFEGEPARPISERRLKRSPLRDVAGMLRSFNYAAFAALFQQVDRGMIRDGEIARFEPWAEFWNRRIANSFMNAYLETAGDASFVPRPTETLEVMVNAYLLEKAIYELGYEINHRPQWLRIPIHGILQILDTRLTQ